MAQEVGRGRAREEGLKSALDSLIFEFDDREMSLIGNV